MKKQFASFICSLSAAMCLTSCVVTLPADVPVSEVKKPVPEKETAESTSSPEKSDDCLPAFGKVLWDAYLQGILPDGSPLDYSGVEAAAYNQFAIADIDNDGREELVLEWSAASCMAGMVSYVFDYENGEIHEEFSEFPALTFYDNGIIVALWSHSQGLAGDSFWPYNAWNYDAESDTYLFLGGADAWDRTLADTDFEGNYFPIDIDADGDSLVYYILPADWDGHYPTTLVDGAVYEEWRSSFLNGAKEMKLSYQKLSEEAIAALGCPKPEVVQPEPLG